MKHFSGDMADTVKSQRKDLTLSKYENKFLDDALLNMNDRELAQKLKRMQDD